MKISNPKRATQILILILKIMEKRRKKAKVVEEAEVAEEAEEVVAKAENKRRLGQKGENTKLEVKKKIKHQKVRINSDVKEKSVEVKSASDMPGGTFSNRVMRIICDGRNLLSVIGIGLFMRLLKE